MQKPLKRECSQNGLPEKFQKLLKKAPEDIYITLNLSTVRTLQAKWNIELFDEMTSEWSKYIFSKGW